MEALITKNEAAAMLGVNPRTITRWQNREMDPLPLAKSKPKHKYDIAAIFEWGLLQRLSKLSVSEDGIAYDYLVERARLTHEQADKVELENEQLRGELIPREVVEATWAEMVSHMRGRFLGMPTKLAPAIQGSDDLAEIRAVLTDGVYEALTELASDGLPKDAQDRVKHVAESLGKDKCVGANAR